MDSKPVRVLLVDDDEDEYVILSDLLAEVERGGFDQKLVRVSLSRTKRISAVLRALDRMVEEMDIRTTDYVGLQDAMFDIEEELRRTLEGT